MIPVRKFVDTVDSTLSEENDKSKIPDWDSLLIENGYHCVSIPDTRNWAAAHDWLKGNVGAREYVWVGYNFYFTHQTDAVLFALKWA